MKQKPLLRPGSHRDVVSENVIALMSQGFTQKQAVAMALTFAQQSGPIYGRRSSSTRQKIRQIGGV